MQPEEWFEERSWNPIPEQAKALSEIVKERGIRLGVVLPCCDDASTLGKHLLALKHGWPGGSSPWCEISVVDLGSLDSTLEIARSQDARILQGEERIIPGELPLEGVALVRAIEQLGCEIVLVAPAGLRRIDWERFSGLVLSLLEHPQAVVAIGYESEPSSLSSLAIRPLLCVLEERLSLVIDPACPALAVRCAGIKQIQLAGTMGYEPALLHEVHQGFGLEGMVQVPIGKLFWSEGERRFQEDVSFRSILALLEAARRHQTHHNNGEFGHLFPTMKISANGVISRKAALQLFPWLGPVERGFASHPPFAAS